MSDKFEAWLRTACFQPPTKEAYDLAKCAWNAALEEAIRECDSLYITTREQEEAGLRYGQIALRVASSAIALAATKLRNLELRILA